MIYSIEQIKRLRNSITKGDWTYTERTNGYAEWGQPDPPPVYVVEGPDYSVDCLVEDAIDHEPDAELMARAPEIVDYLLDRYEKNEREIEALWHLLARYEKPTKLAALVTLAREELDTDAQDGAA